MAAFLEIARPLIERGIPVIPVQPNEKRCLLPEWQKKATTDIEVVRQWNQENPNFNVGCVGKPDGFAMLDCDVVGLREQIERETRQKLPRTLVVKSAGKGAEHIYFRQTDESRRLGNRKSAGLFDLQSVDKYVVGPGSTLSNGKSYEVVDGSGIADFPVWLGEWIERHSDMAKEHHGRGKGAPVHPDFDFDGFCDHFDFTFVGGKDDRHFFEACPYKGDFHTSGGGKPDYPACAIMYDGSTIGFSDFATSCEGNGKTIGDLIRFRYGQGYGKYDGVIFDTESTEELIEIFGAEEAVEACGQLGCNCPKRHAEGEGRDRVIKEDDDREAALREKVLTITPEERAQIKEIRRNKTLQIFDLSDLGNAHRFEYRHGDEFLHTQAVGWLAYTGGLWTEDKTAKADQAMVQAIGLIAEEAFLTDDGKAQEKILAFAQSSKSNSKINAALERASKLGSIARDYAEFDRFDNFFHCSNGEFDLETGTLVPHSPDLLATKGSNVKHDPTAACPGFERYLREAMGGDESLIAYLRRCAGYTLTVSTGEAAMFILTGPSGTGKTTFLSILAGVLGTYAKRAQRGTFMLKRGDEGQPFDYAGLEGCRAFIASETEEGKQIAVAKVKEITGNEASVTACRKFRDSYEFKPKCKVWLACNDFPKAPAGDEALWDRLKPVPFNVKFRDTRSEIKDLAEKLVQEEGSGILNWMLRGLEEYMDIGLSVPEEAKQKAQELRDEQDFLGRFLEERTARTDANGEMVLVSRLYDTFKMHSDATGEGRGWTRTKFNAEMRAKGHEDKKVRVGDQTPRVWVGVKLVSTISGGQFMGNVEVL
ncbi:MAG: phage/plasmid primase, P4 family [Terriglobales bacterium]